MTTKLRRLLVFSATRGRGQRKVLPPAEVLQMFVALRAGIHCGSVVLRRERQVDNADSRCIKCSHTHLLLGGSHFPPWVQG